MCSTRERCGTRPRRATGRYRTASVRPWWRVGGRRSAARCRYRLCAGRIVAERVAVEISDEEIRRQVDRALYPGVAADRKLATFAEAFRCLAWDLDPACFEILYDVPGDPTLSVARLPPPALAELGAVAGRIFDRDETREGRRRVRRQRRRSRRFHGADPTARPRRRLTGSVDLRRVPRPVTRRRALPWSALGFRSPQNSS